MKFNPTPKAVFHGRCDEAREDYADLFNDRWVGCCKCCHKDKNLDDNYEFNDDSGYYHVCCSMHEALICEAVPDDS